MALDLQKELLGIGEEAAIKVVQRIARPLAEQMIRDSATPIDDILLPFIGQLEDAIVQVLDEIDGEDDI